MIKLSLWWTINKSFELFGTSRRAPVEEFHGYFQRQQLALALLHNRLCEMTSRGNFPGWIWPAKLTSRALSFFQIVRGNLLAVEVLGNETTYWFQPIEKYMFIEKPLKWKRKLANILTTTARGAFNKTTLLSHSVENYSEKVFPWKAKGLLTVTSTGNVSD